MHVSILARVFLSNTGKFLSECDLNMTFYDIDKAKI